LREQKELVEAALRLPVPHLVRARATPQERALEPAAVAEKVTS
jgi:hypothetical protein